MWVNGRPRYHARPDKEDGLPRAGALPHRLVNNGRLPAAWKPDERFGLVGFGLRATRFTLGPGALGGIGD